jgi:hypothetical protein
LPEWLGDSAGSANFGPKTIQDGGGGRTDRLMPTIFSDFFNGTRQRREPNFRRLMLNTLFGGRDVE